jgi:ferredoxin
MGYSALRRGGLVPFIGQGRRNLRWRPAGMYWQAGGRIGSDEMEERSTKMATRVADDAERISGTRAFMAEARRTPGFTWLDLAHGYVYARWPYLYIGIGTGEHIVGKIGRAIARLIAPLAAFIKRLAPPKQERPKGVAATYHGKVLPIDAAKRLVMVGEEVELKDLEQVIPFPKARDIILKNPDHIVVLECPCRSSRPNPCLPLDVCLVIGEPFAGLVLQHHPQRSRAITPQEAVQILVAEHGRGHVHHAFFKDAMLGRYYAICNCCSCCCGAMHAMRNGSPMLISSGYVSKVDPALCVGCGACEDACPFRAIHLVTDMAVVDAATCMGCGVCVSACGEGALALVRDAAKSAPLEIEALLAQAAPEDCG